MRFASHWITVGHGFSLLISLRTLDIICLCADNMCIVETLALNNQYSSAQTFKAVLFAVVSINFLSIFFLSGK